MDHCRNTYWSCLCTKYKIFTHSSASLINSFKSQYLRGKWRATFRPCVVHNIYNEHPDLLQIHIPLRALWSTSQFLWDIPKSKWKHRSIGDQAFAITSLNSWNSFSPHMHGSNSYYIQITTQGLSCLKRCMTLISMIYIDLKHLFI